MPASKNPGCRCAPSSRNPSLTGSRRASPAAAQKDLARLMAEAARISSQLRALEQAGHGGDYKAELDDISRSLADIRTLLLQAMGRSP